MHIQSAAGNLAAKRTRGGQGGESHEAPLLIPVKAAAMLLNISEMTIRRAFDAGEFPGMRFGRSYRVSRPFVLAVLGEVRAGRQVVVEEFAANWLARARAAAHESLRDLA